MVRDDLDDCVLALVFWREFDEHLHGIADGCVNRESGTNHH